MKQTKQYTDTQTVVRAEKTITIIRYTTFGGVKRVYICILKRTNHSIFDVYLYVFSCPLN